MTINKERKEKITSIIWARLIFGGILLINKTLWALSMKKNIRIDFFLFLFQKKKKERKKGYRLLHHLQELHLLFLPFLFLPYLFKLKRRKLKKKIKINKNKNKPLVSVFSGISLGPSVSSRWTESNFPCLNSSTKVLWFSFANIALSSSLFAFNFGWYFSINL